jgi:cellulose synthase/poly-beta-1,6-N-acetylglucosamine synthase-like glycosyltransferase
MEMVSLVEWLAGIFGVTLAVCSLLEAIELYELLRWGRLSNKITPRPSKVSPFVSFHVPICSEPPEVVGRTLLALNNLDYDHFEVLVIDNNTADDRLWKPIEQLCAELGSRFRFFRLPVWPGYKAGALNFALQNTAAQATLIGVVDADYEIDSNYLADIAGFFEDGDVAFVQTPQDYRNWGLGRFFRMCHWEYWQVFAVSMVLRNRRNAILMHGTMSLVRKQTLQNAGEWAEWCLTEDSELGLRILASGHRGIYVPKTYGRGLIPYSYRDYKRQRRRWVIGGAQELKRHLRLFLPRGRQGKRLSLGQKLHYLQGWLPWFRCSVIVVSTPFAMAAGAAVILDWAPPGALTWLGLGMVCVILQLILRQFIVFGLYLSLPWYDAIGASIAGCSLTWVTGCGWLAGSTMEGLAFQRTPKIPQLGLGGMEAAQNELLAGGAMLALAVLIASRIGISGAWCAICLASYAALFLPAAIVAQLSARQGVSEKVCGQKAEYFCNENNEQ